MGIDFLFTDRMPPIHESCYRVSMIIVCVLAAPFACIYGICTCGYRCLESHYTGKPMAGPCGTGHRTAMRRWEIEKALKKEAPVPLPATRKRTLTIMPDASPQPSLLWRRRKATSNQLQSNFFGRLPLEIRSMVYAFTLVGSDHVHVHRRADRRLSHYGCGEQDGKMCPTGSSWPSVRTISGAVTVGGKPDGDRHDLLSFLMACRRMLGIIPLKPKKLGSRERSKMLMISQILRGHRLSVRFQCILFPGC